MSNEQLTEDYIRLLRRGIMLCEENVQLRKSLIVINASHFHLFSAAGHLFGLLKSEIGIIRRKTILFFLASKNLDENNNDSI